MNYVNANKTKITGALLVLFGVLQTQSETIRGLLDERAFAWFTIAVGCIVAVLGFLNSGGTVAPPAHGNEQGNARTSALLGLLAAAVLTACGTLGLPQLNSFNERLAGATSTISTVRDTAAVLVNADVITAEDGQNVLEQTDHARAGVDIARTLRSVDPEAADAKLRASIQILNALEAYLRSRQ